MLPKLKMECVCRTRSVHQRSQFFYCSSFPSSVELSGDGETVGVRVVGDGDRWSSGISFDFDFSGVKGTVGEVDDENCEFVEAADGDALGKSGSGR